MNLPGLNRRLRPHGIRHVLREQGMDQTDEFPGGQDESAFVLMFRHFLIFAPVVGLEVQVELAQTIGSKNGVVAQIDVADFGQASILRNEPPRGAPLPSQTAVLSQLRMVREARDGSTAPHVYRRSRRGGLR